MGAHLSWTILSSLRDQSITESFSKNDGNHPRQLSCDFGQLPLTQNPSDHEIMELFLIDLIHDIGLNSWNSS
ncbi:hypothetical protein KM043_010859 [Ampulex compressa]|nr:hypothetical protein KM043_010859 [Ampulex compressa]